MEFKWDFSGGVVATLTVSKQIEKDDVTALFDLNLAGAKYALMKQAKANETKPSPSPEAAADAATQTTS